MGPFKGLDTDPSTVVLPIEAIARIKGLSVAEARQSVRDNVRVLFQL